MRASDGNGLPDIDSGQAHKGIKGIKGRSLLRCRHRVGQTCWNLDLTDGEVGSSGNGGHIETSARENKGIKELKERTKNWILRERRTETDSLI
jgi:hypothetical protein